jgi:proline iminopeptidase
MRKILQIRVTAGFLALLLIGGGVQRAFSQDRKQTSDALNEGAFVKIGGIDQWIQISGQNKKNPVLLILHGGPGFSYLGLSETFRAWEERFTVVQWDQRGTGKTYARNGAAGSAPMTIERMKQDGIEVAEFVKRRFDNQRIILFAHSWGTVLGLPMVASRPDLFAAYVGAGQIVNMARNETASYDLVLERVRALNDAKAVSALERLGRPPYKDFRTWMIKGRMVVMYAPPTAGGRSLPNVFTPELIAGFNFSSQALYDELMNYDADRLGKRFKVPVFIIQGDSDIQAPTNLAKEFLASIKAPKKQLVVLNGEGHTAVLTNPEAVLRILLDLVTPIAAKRKA